MRILFWTNGFWPRIGGMETQALQFIKNLQKKDYQYLVLAQKDHPTWKEDETYQDISIRRFDYDEMIATRNPKNLRLFKETLEWIEKEFQPKLLHLNVCVGRSALAFLLFRNMFRIPIIVTVHAPLFYKSTIPPLIEKIFPVVDQVCCVSNWVLNETKKILPVTEYKLRLIYNGLPMPEIPPTPLSFSPPTLLLLGRLSWEKGFETAIEAFSLLKKSDPVVRLLIAGEGNLGPFLKHLVHHLGLIDSVQFIGEVERAEVPSLINRATLVIVPSYSESFGLVALEAMQMQRPVIASDIGGLPEVISDGETGLLVPPRDPLALCRGIQSLLEDPEKAIRMGLQGRKRAVEKFTIHQNMTQYENAYNKLIGNML